MVWGIGPHWGVLPEGAKTGAEEDYLQERG